MNVFAGRREEGDVERRVTFGGFIFFYFKLGSEREGEGGKDERIWEGREKWLEEFGLFLGEGVSLYGYGLF